jgi:hypothetical protein
LPGFAILPLVITGGICRIMGIDVQLHSTGTVGPADTIDRRRRFVLYIAGKKLLTGGRRDPQPVLCGGVQRQRTGSISPRALFRQGIDRIVSALDLAESPGKGIVLLNVYWVGLLPLIYPSTTR